METRSPVDQARSARFAALFALAAPALVSHCATRNEDARLPGADATTAAGSENDTGTEGLGAPPSGNGDDVGIGDSADPSTGPGIAKDSGTGDAAVATANDAAGDALVTPAGDGAGMGDGQAPGDAAGSGGSPVKPRVVAMTDIGFDPDDQESLVRYLVYSNEFDTEALIAITSVYLKSNPREDLIRGEVAAYDQVRPNLLKHAAGFPDAASLLAVTKTGQAGYGMTFVGPGKSTAGSQQLIALVDKPDSRPVWVTIWGGANTLAQALQDVMSSRSTTEVSRFVAKLRVYSISDQDDAGAWLRKTFPQLFYVVSPSNQTPADYPRATWTGISGDRQYKNGPFYKFDLVDNPWLQANVILNHGPLGALYPNLRWIMEGDTPSYIGLIENGLGWAVSPDYGGWGGRYSLLQVPGETHAIWTNDSVTTSDTVALDDGGTATSDQATIWRWRQHYQNDFAARMNWCIADQFAKANHNPVAVLNGDLTKGVLTLPVKGGTTVALAADGTSDPDGDPVHVTWWIYREAGTLTAAATLSATDGPRTQVSIPMVQSPSTLHVILQVEDSGNPHLFAYRRAVLEVTP